MSEPKAAKAPEREKKTCTVGKHKLEMVELSLKESRAVDKYVDTDDETGMPRIYSLSQTYALASIRSIDGDFVNPCASEVHWNKVEGAFTAMEGVALVAEYGKLFGKPETGEALKNASSDPA